MGYRAPKFQQGHGCLITFVISYFIPVYQSRKIASGTFDLRTYHLFKSKRKNKEGS